MKFKIIVLLAFVAILFACSQDSLLNDLTKSADEDALQTEMTQFDLKKGKAVTRPFKLRGSGTFTPTGGTCDSGLAQVLIDGSGNATHLGLFKAEITYCTDLGNDPGIHILEGTLTAANGDKMFFYSNNIIDPGDSGMDAGGVYSIYHYENGTGRFEDGYGEFKLYGIVDYVNGVYSNYGEGYITY